MFFVVNSDVFWLDGKDYALARLAAAFDPERMDAVLLLQRTVTAVGYEGSGDYFLDALGTPRRRGEREIAPYLFSRHPAAAPPRLRRHRRTAFSRWTGSTTAPRPPARLHAIVHDGEWFHVGTPEGLAATRARLLSHRIEPTASSSLRVL